MRFGFLTVSLLFAPLAWADSPSTPNGGDPAQPSRNTVPPLGSAAPTDPNLPAGTTAGGSPGQGNMDGTLGGEGRNHLDQPTGTGMGQGKDQNGRAVRPEDAPLGTQSETQTGRDAGTGPLDETKFLQDVHAANLAEIQEGNLAASKASSPKVKKYGQMLVKDHTEAEALVSKEASRLRISLADALPPSAKGDIDQLDSASGDAFDKVFTTIETTGHQKMITEAETARKTIGDSGVRKLAGKLLPKLKMHEEAAKRLSKQTPRV